MRPTLLLIALLSAGPARAAPLLCPAGETRIAAHRGRLDGTLTENSLVQMRATTRAAPYMLEIDLAPTSDGPIFLLHDEMLDRTTDGHGPPAAITSAAAAKLRLHSGERFPRFTDIGTWAGQTPDALLMLDIKHTPPAAVAPIVRAYRLIPRVLVLTFVRTTAEQAIAADRDWLVSVLVKDETELASYKALFGKRRFVAYVSTDAPIALFAAARAAGALVLTDAMAQRPGGSIDENADREGVSAYARFAAERQLDILVTDHAGRLPACLKR